MLRPVPLVQISLPLPAKATAGPVETGSLLAGDVYVLPLESGRYLIYAPLSRSAFIGSTRVARVAQAMDSGRFSAEMDPDGKVVTLLGRMGMLRGQAVKPFGHDRGPEDALEVTLLLTTACNLRCSYCYALAGETPLEFMEMPAARSGIEFVANNAKRLGAPFFSVSYHGGGEPTANWKVLTESALHAHQRARELGLGTRITLTTNGVFSEAKAEWLTQHTHAASVSFDGPPDMHDASRYRQDGTGSSAEVERTLGVFDRLGYSYGIRMTVTSSQVARLPDSVEYVYTRFHPSSILVEPVYQMGRGAAEEDAESEDFIEAFRQARRRAARLGRGLDFSGARAGVVTKHFCGITRDNFCLSAKGNVTACYEVFSESNEWANKFFFARPSGPSGEYVFDNRVTRGLRSQTADNRQFCDGCFAQWTCGGDCYHKALTLHGDTGFQGAGRCNVIRQLTKDLILEKIAAAGGLCWREA